LSVLTYGYLYYSQPIFWSISPFPPSVLLFSPHSFYTCRYLHILIYILSSLLLLISLPIYPARSIGVDG
jgi:hypothetical protein